MKQNAYTFFTVSLLCLSTGITPLHAQVFSHPNTNHGTVRFINTNPAILNLLKAPGNEGMSNLVVLADSLPPAPPIEANTDTLPVTSRTSAVYQVIVESDVAPGIAYSVAPRVVMEGQQYVYWFNAQSSAPVIIGLPPPPLDFNECVGVVTVQFTTSGGAPVTVDGGIITGFDAVTGDYTGQGSLLPGVTQQRVYLRGGRTHRLDITVHRGTDFYTNRIESFLSTNVVVTCDQFSTVRMVIPDGPSLATVSGTVDMLREFEFTVSGNPGLEFSPDYTSVIASYGPFLNQRWGRVPGVNFTTPSSGPYELASVVPSTLDPSSSGYVVYAQMAFRTNRMAEAFVTPALGWGSNPPLVVAPGVSLDLTNLLEINPGYMRGRVLLQGPAESLGRVSLLRGLLHAGDVTIDGIPAYLGTYGIYWTTVNATGVDRRATDASFTAAFGSAAADFDGAFNPGTSAYEGQYELALGGLAGENSIWKRDGFSLILESGTVTNDNDYFDTQMFITDARANEVEIHPTEPVTNDVAYCFGEVKIVFRTTSGTFYNPRIRYGSAGSFTNIDFQGRPADYNVLIEGVSGTPNTSATASNIGQTVMYLPQGTYQLLPGVTPASGTYALTGLLPIDITVGCRQQIALEPCLQLILEAPACANTQLAHLTGSVRSCTNNVASLSYTLNGGPSQLLCGNCGQNPSFSFDITLTGECVDNVLTVTATDEFDGVSSVTTAIHYDATPPVIQCPTDLVASACDTNGAVVNYTVTATDNCPGPVTLICTPPSGSSFPLGTTTVICLAADACGNTNQCSFTVTVGGSELSIERAVIVRWNCGGTLQSADEITGPWTDVPGATSPYCVAATAAHRFYRVRN